MKNRLNTIQDSNASRYKHFKVRVDHGHEKHQSRRQADRTSITQNLNPKYFTKINWGFDKLKHENSTKKQGQ
jgi:hypothetical protein